jgi:hypothetical protein
MGIITSAPVPVDQRMGTNPNRETETVINFGLSLCRAINNVLSEDVRGNCLTAIAMFFQPSCSWPRSSK